MPTHTYSLSALTELSNHQHPLPAPTQNWALTLKRHSMPTAMLIPSQSNDLQYLRPEFFGVRPGRDSRNYDLVLRSDALVLAV